MELKDRKIYTVVNPYGERGVIFSEPYVSCITSEKWVFDFINNKGKK